MKAVPTKTDDVGQTVPAEVLNSTYQELSNTVTNTNQTLDITGETVADPDKNQLQKAIAAYSNVGNIYDDSGTGAAYVLSYNLGGLVHVNQYYTNMLIRFKVGNTNTAVAPTVNLNGLGTKIIKRPDGTALVLGDLTAGDTVILKYDGTDFLLLTGFFKSSIKSVNNEDVILAPHGTGIISATKNIVMADGAGINFTAFADGSVAGTTVSETLNDYEEGTWVPTNVNGLNGTEVGHYTKIGNYVVATGFVQNDNAGVTNVSFGGLPFTNHAGTNFEGIGVVGYQQETAGETWGITTIGNTSTFTFYVASVKKTLSSTNGAFFVIHYFTT